MLKEGKIMGELTDKFWQEYGKEMRADAQPALQLLENPGKFYGYIDTTISLPQDRNSYRAFLTGASKASLISRTSEEQQQYFEINAENFEQMQTLENQIMRLKFIEKSEGTAYKIPEILTLDSVLKDEEKKTTIKWKTGYYSPNEQIFLKGFGYPEIFRTEAYARLKKEEEKYETRFHYYALSSMGSLAASLFIWVFGLQPILNIGDEATALAALGTALLSGGLIFSAANSQRNKKYEQKDIFLPIYTGEEAVEELARNYLR